MHDIVPTGDTVCGLSSRKLPQPHLEEMHHCEY
jgi:hypothetical protein